MYAPDRALYKNTLKTLRRVPDDVIIAVAGDDLELWTGTTCLCGYIVRESIAKLRQVAAAKVDVETDRTYELCLHLYGGEPDAWDDIYTGVVDEDALPTIERAWTKRVDEAVTASLDTRS